MLTVLRLMLVVLGVKLGVIRSDIMSMIRTYTETYDMNTEKDSPCILAVHTPIGKAPRQFLEPAFRMYRKFKYLGCDLTIVNSARLPVDPEQVGRIEGTNYVDPRDTLNPILFKGCHGESINGILNSMYAGLTSEMFKESSLDKTKATSTLSNFYYTAIGDDSWRKSPIQKTLTIRGLHPLVYGLATQHQLMPTNDMDVSNYSMNNPRAVTPSSGSATTENGISSSVSASWNALLTGPTQISDPTDASAPYLQQLMTMFTNKVQRMGWMDTMQFVGNQTASAVGWTRGQVTQLPKIFMGLLILPPAYLCRQYLRVIIRHKFVFKGYRSVTTGGIDSEQWNPYVASYGYYDEVTGNVPDTSSKDIDDSYLGRAPVSADEVPGEVEPDESE